MCSPFYFLLFSLVLLFSHLFYLPTIPIFPSLQLSPTIQPPILPLSSPHSCLPGRQQHTTPTYLTFFFPHPLLIALTIYLCPTMPSSLPTTRPLLPSTCPSIKLPFSLFSFSFFHTFYVFSVQPPACGCWHCPIPLPCILPPQHGMPPHCFWLFTHRHACTLLPHHPLYCTFEKVRRSGKN